MGRYLIQRGNRYHLRVRIPRDLRPLFGRGEIQRSLGAPNKRTAATMAARLAAKIAEQFAALRYQQVTGTDAASLTAMAKGLYLDQLPAQRPLLGRTLEDGQSPGRNSPRDLDDCIRLFIEDRRQHWQAKTILLQSGALRLFKTIVGNKPIVQVSREDCRHFQRLLTRLPSNMTKRFPSASIEEVLALKPEPMSLKNANRIITALTSFMNWCVREGHIQQSPASGLLFRVTERPDSERAAYTPDQLKRLFNALDKETGARFWVPRIALLSGMRLEEILQLHTGDVTQVDGVWVFDINSRDGKRLKTSSSERYVPIHRHLIACGILKMVARARPGGQKRLWPDAARAADGTYSSTFSKWFGRFRRDQGISGEKHTFHSFRHTFINELKQMKVDEVAIKELVGHRNDSITTGRYGKRLSPRLLSKHVSAIRFSLP